MAKKAKVIKAHQSGKHECFHKLTRAHAAEVKGEVRRDGPSDASRWSDGGRRGDECRSRNQDDMTNCSSGPHFTLHLICSAALT